LEVLRYVNRISSEAHKKVLDEVYLAFHAELEISQTEKIYFAQEIFFPWEKCAEMLVFSKEICGRPRDPAVRKCLSNSKIGNVLSSQLVQISGSQKHFVQILQKLFAVFYNLKNFAQISVIVRIFAQEIIFLHSQNFIVWEISDFACLSSTMV
jgi:ABC-type uncharacterized transport system YnjBCD ATPase subunit